MKVYRRTIRGKRSRTYYGEYTHPQTGKRVRLSLRRTDRATAEAALRQHVHRAEREAAGLVDPHEEHKARPLVEHLDEWRATLLAKGRSEKYANGSRVHAGYVVDGCGLKRWGDIQASRVQAWLGDQRREGMGAVTCNHRLRAFKSFCRWMVRDGRAAESPVAHLDRLNERTDRRHERRVLADDEIRMLLDTTAAGPIRYGLSGQLRSLAYRTALESGLRAAELRSLMPGSFDLDADPPTITVAAAYSKRRREDVQPVRTDFARAVAPLVARCSASQNVFPLPEATSRMLQADLEPAGIEYRDDAGRVADFHSLRHTFVSRLASSGVHPKEAQTLARHSTITLTMDRYTHIAVGRVAGALEKMPSLDAPVEHAAARATGTDDRCVPNMCQLTDHDRALEARSATIVSPLVEAEEPTIFRGKPRSLVPKGTAPPRTRTSDPLIKNQLLCQLS